MKIRTKHLWIGSVASFLVGVGACSDTGSTTTEATHQNHKAATHAPGSVVGELPSWASPFRNTFVALEKLDVRDRVRVHTSGNEATTVAALDAVEVGADAVVGSVTSGRYVLLRERARVQQDVIAGGPIDEQNGVSVGGSRSQNVPLPSGSLSFQLELAQSTLDVQSTTTPDLHPGRIRELKVEQGNIRLHSGTYLIDRLQVEPTGQLLVDDSEGPVILLVAESIIFRGRILGANNDVPDVMLAYAGTQPFSIGGQWTGDIFAPQAAVIIDRPIDANQPHQGTALARSITVEAGNDSFIHRPSEAGYRALCSQFDFCRWVDFGSPSGCVAAAPVLLVGRDGADERPLLELGEIFSRVHSALDRTPQDARAVMYLNSSTEGFPSLGSAWRDDIDARKAVWADLDGDGLDELLLGRSGPEIGTADDRVIIFDDSSRGFEQMATRHTVWGDRRDVTALAAGDIDGDGLDEFALGRSGGVNQEMWIHDDANNDFQILRDDDFSNRRVLDMVFADVDGDGREELVLSTEGSIGRRSERIHIYDDAQANFRRVGLANFEDADREVRAVDVGDIDGDGVPELAAGRGQGGGGRILIYHIDPETLESTGIGDFGHDWGDDRRVNDLKFGDLDGDGDDELVVGRNHGGGPRVLIFDGPLVEDGSRQRMTEIGRLGEAWGESRGVIELVVADLDGDGVDEIAVGRSEGGGPRVEVFDDALHGFDPLYELGRDWDSERAVQSLAASNQRYCMSRAPSPTPDRPSVADQQFAQRRSDIVLTWVDRFLESGFGEWSEEDKPARTLNMILAGFAAIELGLPPAGQLLSMDFPNLAADWIVAHAHAHAQFGTVSQGEGDMDFQVMPALALLNRFATTPHPAGQGEFLLRNDAFLALMLHDRECPEGTQDLGGRVGGRCAFPFAGNTLHKPRTDIYGLLEVPETENHMLMINTWSYLINQLIRDNPRNLPELAAFAAAHAQDLENSGSDLETGLLDMTARIVQNGYFETNARPYQSLTTRALLILASYAGGESVRTGARNALDFGMVKFAFQSHKGRRFAPMRRNYEYRARTGLYLNDHMHQIAGVLAGSTVRDTSPDCEGVLCPYTLGRNGGEYALITALTEYRLPPQVLDFMLRPDNHQPGYGAWARMQPRYAAFHYTWDSDPLHFPNGPWTPGELVPDNLDLNQAIRTGSVPIVRAPELYFSTLDYLNSAGGSHELFPGFALGSTGSLVERLDQLADRFNLPGAGELDRRLNDYTVVAKPSSVISGIDMGYWDSPGAAESQMLILRGKHDAFWESHNWGTYKSFTVGYSDVREHTPIRLPSAWEFAAQDQIGEATFAVVDSFTTRQNFPAFSHYVVMGSLPTASDQEIASIGFWEIVPRALFANEAALLDHVLSVNQGNALSPGGPYEYTLASSGETVRIGSHFYAQDELPFEAIDGSASAAQSLHIAANAADMPLIDVRQVNERYQFTDVRYVFSEGDGIVEIRNPCLGTRLVLDSSDPRAPTRREDAIEASSGEACQQIREELE